MANPTIQMIEAEAKRLYPGKSQMAQRFAYRNELRARFGLGAEKKQRGGAAGVYDRNKQYTGAALAIGGALIGAPLLLPAALRPAAAALTRLSARTQQVRRLASSLTNTGGTMGLKSEREVAGGLSYSGARANSFAGGVGGSVVGTVLGQVAGNVLTGIANRIGGGPPAFPAQGFGQVPQPLEGIIGRTVSRLLPGGLTGREFTPVNDMTDRIGRPIAVYPMERTSTVGPSGYVVVEYGGKKVAMLKSFAIRAGLYKAPPKPPVSGYDMRAITRAASAAKRVKKLAGKVGFRCEKRGSRAAAPKLFARKK